MPRLLVVEDQKKLLVSLTSGLKKAGYEVVARPLGLKDFDLHRRMYSTPSFSTSICQVRMVSASYAICVKWALQSQC